MQGTVVIVCSDLMFQPRIRDAAEARGLAAVVADSAASAAEAIATRPDVVVIDLHVAGVDANAVIAAAKVAGSRVLAFGRHTEPVTLRAARAAGADAVVPRSELGELLATLAPAAPKS
jgi:DNA-binding NarL/FixJ family response regulator